MKLIANQILGIFERYTDGECTRDRALEDISKIIEKHVDEKPIVGYVKSGVIKKIFSEIINNKKVSEDKSYIFDIKLHNNEIEQIERIIKIL